MPSPGAACRSSYPGLHMVDDTLDSSQHIIKTGIESTFEISRLTDTRVAGYAASYRQPSRSLMCLVKTTRSASTPRRSLEHVSGDLYESRSRPTRTSLLPIAAARRSSRLSPGVDSFLDSLAAGLLLFVTPCTLTRPPAIAFVLQCTGSGGRCHAPWLKKQLPVTLCRRYPLHSVPCLCPLSQIARTPSGRSLSVDGLLSDNLRPPAHCPKRRRQSSTGSKLLRTRFASPIDTSGRRRDSTPTTVTYPDGPLYGACRPSTTTATTSPGPLLPRSTGRCLRRCKT